MRLGEMPAAIPKLFNLIRQQIFVRCPANIVRQQNGPGVSVGRREVSCEKVITNPTARGVYLADTDVCGRVWS